MNWWRVSVGCVSVGCVSVGCVSVGCVSAGCVSGNVRVSIRHWFDSCQRLYGCETKKARERILLRDD